MVRMMKSKRSCDGCFQDTIKSKWDVIIMTIKLLLQSFYIPSYLLQSCTRCIGFLLVMATVKCFILSTRLLIVLYKVYGVLISNGNCRVLYSFHKITNTKLFWKNIKQHKNAKNQLMQVNCFYYMQPISHWRSFSFHLMIHIWLDDYILAP